jgi:hypothetical protein
MLGVGKDRNVCVRVEVCANVGRQEGGCTVGSVLLPTRMVSTVLDREVP